METKKGKSDHLSYNQKLLVNNLTKFFCNTGQIEKILPILECKSVISLRLIDWFVTNYSKKYGISYSLSEYANKNKNFNRYSLVKKSKYNSPKSSKDKKKALSVNEESLLNNNKKEAQLNIDKAEDAKNAFLDGLSGANLKNKKFTEKTVIEELGDSDTDKKVKKNLKEEIESKTIDQYLADYKKEGSPRIQPIKTPFSDLFFVYNDYRRQLKSYNKKSFDVFRRDGSFDFYYKENSAIETNEGQLNFFRWALQNYIVDYIYDHLEAIEKDMNDRTGKKDTKSQRKSPRKANTIATDKFIEKENCSKSRKKRTELSESSLRKVYKINSPSVVSFK